MDVPTVTPSTVRRANGHSDSITMISPIRIPKSSYEALNNLIKLSEFDFGMFIQALSKAEPSLVRSNFWEHVATHAPSIDRSVIKSILNELFQMDAAREDAATDGLTTEQFSEAVKEALVSLKSDQFSFEEKDGEILKQRIINLFDGDNRGLKITMK